MSVQGYFAHKKLQPPTGLSQGPRHEPIVGTCEEAVYYARVTPVAQWLEFPVLHGGARGESVHVLVRSHAGLVINGLSL